MGGSSRRRGEGLQRETHQPQHADDAERRDKEREPDESEDAVGEHQKERQPATSDRRGDKVRVVVKKKFEKGYMPEWSDEVYTAQRVSKGHNAAPLTYISYQPIMDRQGMYLLNDPNNTLNNYKNGMFTRSEHLLFEKALIL